MCCVCIIIFVCCVGLFLAHNGGIFACDAIEDRQASIYNRVRQRANGCWWMAFEHTGESGTDRSKETIKNRFSWRKKNQVQCRCWDHWQTANIETAFAHNNFLRNRNVFPFVRLYVFTGLFLIVWHCSIKCFHKWNIELCGFILSKATFFMHGLSFDRRITDVLFLFRILFVFLRNPGYFMLSW